MKSHAEYMRRYRAKNKERVTAMETGYKRNYRKTDEGRESDRRYCSTYHSKNKESRNNKKRELYYINADRYNAKSLECKNRRRKEDGLFRVICALRGRMRSSALSSKKGKKSSDMFGMDLKNVRVYIGFQFEAGMTWDNYGLWHLDHVIPVASAKSEDEVVKLFHYLNIRPMWKDDNKRKGSIHMGIRYRKGEGVKV